MREFNKQQLVALAILAGLNILIGNLVAGSGRTLAGEAVLAQSPEMRRAVFTTFLVSIPVLSFIIGSLAAVVPFRQKAYPEKWLLFSLSIAIAIQSLALVASTVKLIFW